MIRQIEICFNHKLKVKGERTVRFEPGYNVLVGPNGSGKSTLLKAMTGCEDCQIQREGQGKLLLFDSETMNPHVAAKHNSVIGMILKVRGHFSSHGEILRAALASMQFEAGDCLLIDEPESGQDVDWVRTIREAVDSVVQAGIQVIIASHHPLFWSRAHVVETRAGYLDYSLKCYREGIG